jgi:uncharacterized protein (TIGR00299 family) protein
VIGWLDCSSGASGDMLLGALVGAGVPLDVIDVAVRAVAPERVELRHEEVLRGGLAATRVHVETSESTTHRTWADVRSLLERANVPEPVRETATACFAALARAEAAVHDTTPEQVHFHEVGALDAIADVVGVSAGFAHLRLEGLTCSTVRVGGGSVRAAHGTLPVPPPAVVELLRGVPSAGGPVELELCTPTGAALVSVLATGYGPQPAMRVTHVGTGAGGGDPYGHPNVVRLLVGEPLAAGDDAVALVLEANVDDLDPRLWPVALERLLAAGASDAWLTPILMKKGRPAHTLSVRVPPARRADVLDVVFAETTTIGLRVHEVDKLALERSERSVEIDGHGVRVKVASYAGAVVNAQPEYDDVAAVARATGRPVKSVLAQAGALARLLG